MNLLLGVPNKIVDFFRGVAYEIRQVKWIGKKELIRLTTIVVSTVVSVGLVISIIDIILLRFTTALFDTLI